ncbi:MAG: DUF4390 domain-containing protein [Burkholderiales bacterium]
MRGIALLKKLLIALACAAALAARADEIEVREARLAPAEEGLVLAADFAFDFNPRLAEVVTNGVPLYFVVEFDLSRQRWWWFDEKVVSKRMQLRLSYHALSRQYRLSTGLLQQNYASLEEALNVLRRVRNWLVVDRSLALADAGYEGWVRMRLDTTLLPKPFQLSALTSRDLNLESAWKRFSFRPPAAMLESREPKEADAK